MHVKTSILGFRAAGPRVKPRPGSLSKPLNSEALSTAELKVPTVDLVARISAWGHVAA